MARTDAADLSDWADSEFATFGPLKSLSRDRRHGTLVLPLAAVAVSAAASLFIMQRLPGQAPAASRAAAEVAVPAAVAAALAPERNDPSAPPPVAKAEPDPAPANPLAAAEIAPSAIPRVVSATPAPASAWPPAAPKPRTGVATAKPAPARNAAVKPDAASLTLAALPVLGASADDFRTEGEAGADPSAVPARPASRRPTNANRTTAGAEPAQP